MRLSLSYGPRPRADEEGNPVSKKSTLAPLVPAVLSLLLVAGGTTVFAACDPKPDGSWMQCHSCQNTVAAGAGGLALLFGASAFVKNRSLRLALQALGVVGAAVTFFIPGGICPMCMMRTMRCYTVFQPFVRIMSVLVAAGGVGVLVASMRGRGASALAPSARAGGELPA